MGGRAVRHRVVLGLTDDEGDDHSTAGRRGGAFGLARKVAQFEYFGLALLHRDC
jgi:hypothetical protein